MLESLVANILNRTLGAYVENFDPNQLNIGIWSGDVTLSNLKLKPESLDKLDLPINLKCGHLANLTMQIPWSNLKSKPVKIQIEDCYILATAKLQNSKAYEDEDDRLQRIKRQKLDNLELLSSQSNDSLDESDQLKNQSFTESLIAKVIDNLQVTIKNIHIRYEDFDCYTKTPYAFGITLDELSASSTDENWIPNFIQQISTLSRKLLLLKSLTIYMDTSLTKNTSICSDDQSQMLQNLKDYIRVASSDDSQMEYLLQPISGEGHLTLNKLGSTQEIPHYQLDLFFDQFRINLNRSQYFNLLDTITEMNYYMKTLKFKKNAPTCTIDEDPYKWLKYSFQTVFDEIHERNYKKTWSYMKKRRDQRKLYIPLWKKYLYDKNSLTPDERQKMLQLEDECSYEDLKFYRSLAKLQYKKEYNSLPKSSKQENKGWFSSWWSGNNDSNVKAMDIKPSDDTIEITNEQINEFYDAIEFDESKVLADSLDIPRDRIQLSVDCRLNTGSFVLRQSRSDANMAEFLSRGCHVDFLQRKDSYFVGFKLNAFSVVDGDPNTIFNQIINAKRKDFNINDPTIEDVFKDEPFFQISYEQHPINEIADSELILKMGSVSIFHNRKFIESLMHFFCPPRAHVDTIGSLMNAADRTLQDFTKQTKIGLQYAFEEHKTMNVVLDVQSPLIMLPADPTSWEAPVVIIDAGHIDMVSDLISSEKYEEIRSERKDSYTEEDWKKMNTYMYDKYNVGLHDAHIVVGPDIYTTTKILHDTDNDSGLILHDFSMNLIFEVSIIPSFYSLPKIKMSGEIPDLRAQMSDYQYKILLDLTGNLMPDFSTPDDGSTNSSVDDYMDANSFFNERSDGETSIYLEDSTLLKDLKETSLAEGNNPDSATNQSNSSLKDSPALQQHEIEFNFTMKHIVLSLKRCLDKETMESEILVDIVGDELKLHFYQTQRELHVDMSLADLYVRDYIQTSEIPEFKRLIGAKNENDSTENLFSLAYTRTLRYAHFKGEEIECFDQDINIDVSDLQFVITRKSLLTLINYSLNTFTDVNAPEIPSDKLRHNNEEEINAPAHINIDLKLKSISLLLNDDGLKIATLVFADADASLFLIPDKMRINTKIGGLSLVDNDVHDGSKLINIQGDDLADIYYETFDPEINDLPYDSQFKFESRSLVVTFIEDSFARIYNFLYQFQRMKYIYDSAREAALNQASNVEYPNKMKFDVHVRAPIFVFPKPVDPVNEKFDTITINLGEIRTSNTFTEHKDHVLNLINADLFNTRITTSLNIADEGVQELDIIDRFDIHLNIDYSDKSTGERADVLVTGGLQGNDMKLTELQAFTLIQLSQSLPTIFKHVKLDDEDLEDLEMDAHNANLLISNGASQEKVQENKPGMLKGKFDAMEATDDTIQSSGSSVNFKFHIPVLSLTLFNNTCHTLNISDSELMRFSLNDMGIMLDIAKNGDYTSNLHIKSFTIRDVRQQCKNFFKDIIPEVDDKEYQFLTTINSNKGVTTVDLNIDHPRILLAMDYIVALKSFIDYATYQPRNIVDHYMKQHPAIDETLSITRDENDRNTINNNNNENSTTNYHIKINEPSIVLLADTEKEDSEAVVFKLNKLLVDVSETTNVDASGIGMFLTRMSTDSSQDLRILDDFAFKFVMDSRGSCDTAFLTTIDATVEPLLLRLSLRDIYLAIEIFNKASKMYNSIGQLSMNDNDVTSIAEEIGKTISKYAPSIISSLSRGSNEIHKKLSDKKPDVIVKAEHMNIVFEGFRMVLIGDVHELPILDFDVESFEITAKNWSTDFEADTRIETLINIFNYSLSQWEPMLEPWMFAIHIERNQDGKLHSNFVSKQTAEWTVTTRSIATISHFANLLTETGELKPRGEDSPFRISNHTGYDINVWIDENKDEKRQLTVIRNEETIPWSFEDWRKIRERLSIDSELNSIGIELVDSIYKPLRNVSLRCVGEEVFTLDPPVGNYHNRIVTEITLAEDKVKEVILRSTISIENDTPTAIYIGIGSNYDGNFAIDRQVVIPGGARRALPIDYVYGGALVVRPDTSSEIFGWSKAFTKESHDITEFNWRNIRENDLFLECSATDPKRNNSYFFKVHSESHNDVLNKYYPCMNVVISPPFVFENLLPYDIDWKVFQLKHEKWGSFLKRGTKVPVHVLNINETSILKIDVLGSSFGPSQPAIINSAIAGVYPDNEIILRNHHTQLSLKLLYSTDARYGTKVSIYSPYLWVNKTGKDLRVVDNAHSILCPGRKGDVEGEEYPEMFSFDSKNDVLGFLKGNLEANRIQLKIEDSRLSDSFSIDKIGQSFEVNVGLSDRYYEDNIGIHITEGTGIYKITKVIVASPRYIVKNDLKVPIIIGLVGSKENMTVQPEEICPLYKTPAQNKKEMVIGFEEVPNSMSASFVITEIGEIFLRVKKKDSNAHQLLKVNISTDHATVFVNILDAENKWPYMIKNYTNEEFFIFQQNPNISSDGSITSDVPFTPVLYRVPGKSVMPYAWDFPSAENKELIVKCGDYQRYIRLEEIGEQVPILIKEKNMAFDLNVVAEGVVQSLNITDYDYSKSMYKLKSKKNSNSSSISTSTSNKDADFEAVVDNASDYYTSLIFNFEGVGISLVNTEGRIQELCYITIRGIEFRYNESGVYQTLSMKMKWLQIDNQLTRNVFPVVLYPTVIPKSSFELNNHPVFSASIAKMKDDKHGVTYIKFATVLLQELSIKVDEDFLIALLDFSKIPGASWNKVEEDELWAQNLDIPEPPSIRTTDDLYFEGLHLQPLQFNISFVRTENSNLVSNVMSTQNILSVATDVLTMAIGNINNAPVRLAALLLENIRVPIPYLIKNICDHYTQAFLYQLYKVLGSADVLGNPVGLFNNISSGVMDIFYEPYQGYIMTDRPEELGIGLAKGGLSFLKKSVFGVSDSVSRFTSSMAKGLTVASMDKNFQEQRRLARQGIQNKNHPVNSLSLGATSFISGVSSGITGLATAPLEGVYKEGASGFFKGLGKGLLGLPTKTATGAFDLANNISESIRNTTTAFDNDNIDKVRFPRYIPYDGSIIRYQNKESQGQYWLKNCDNGEFENDHYVAHYVFPGGEYAVIISFQRIVLMNVYELKDQWMIPYDGIKDITLERGGIRIKESQSNSSVVIPLRNPEDRKYLYRQISIAVNEFNKRSIVEL